MPKSQKAPNRPANKPESGLLAGLNDKQSRAVQFGDGPLLIIAGAGTGKTTVLTRRIAWLIESGLAKPEEILALTFTEKAAAEMNDRVDQLMPLGYSEISISTFHAFAQRILQEHALDLGLPTGFRLLTETQAWMLVQRHLSDLDLDYYRPMGNPGRFIHSLLKHFSKAKGEGITPERYLEYAQSLKLNLDSELDLPQAGASKPKKSAKKSGKAAKPADDPAIDSADFEEPMDQAEIQRIREVANAYHVYQKLLLDGNFMDFGDLINYTVRLFQTRPRVLSIYRKKFKYVLVDEFQDTDLAQYEMVKLVAGPRNNITVVGDDDQSIYKFRGASISNILKFKEDFRDAHEITLTDNYRSIQPILDLSYDFIQLNNPERLETRLNISKKLKSHSTDTGEIAVLHSETVHDEAASVAERIVGLVAEKGWGLNDFAILVRANDHAEPFIGELNKRGVPYVFVANRGLYRKPFVLDLLAYLRLLDNYHETENLFRVLTLGKFRISPHDVVELSRTAKKRAWSLYEAIRQVPAQVTVSEDSYKKLASLLVLLDKHTGWASHMPVTELFLKVLDDLGVTKEIMDEDTARNMENRSLLRQLYAKMQNFELDSDSKTVKDFLNMIRLETESGDTGSLAFDPDAGPEAVRIMTVHSAKGLEFRCVFVVNMVEARFPSRDRREQIEVPRALVREILPEGDAHLMEERRLFYVAMTRAKERLYLTWADDYGGTLSKKPSRFLVEAGLESAEARRKPSGEVMFAQKAQLPLPAANPMPIPESFSWTSISAFLKCPLEYKYRYLYQLPTPGNSHTSFGQSVHKAIQLFSQQVKQMNATAQGDLFEKKSGPDPIYPPLSVLHKLYEEHWIDDWYESKIDKERFRQRGYRLLENFYNAMTSRRIIPAETEKFFRVKLGDYRYVGVIDCLYENPDGTIDIIDYKTSKTARKRLEKVDKKQLLGYQWAAEEFLKRKVRCMSYWDLEDLSNIIEFKGTPEEIEAIKAEFAADIEMIVEAIRTDNFLELDLKEHSDCNFREYESFETPA